MKNVRFKYIFLLVFAFLFANLLSINVSETKAEETIDLSNAYIGEITEEYWAVVNYGDDYIGSETVTIFLDPRIIADTRVNYIMIAEFNESTGAINNTYYQRGVDSRFASRFDYVFVNSGIGEKNITIFLLTRLTNDVTDIIDRIDINGLQRFRTIRDLTSADFVISREVTELTSTPYRVYVSIKENPEEYVLKEVRYTYQHKNEDGSTTTINGSAIYDSDNNRYYFTVSENATYYIEVEDHFGYIKPDENDELSIDITNFYGDSLNIIANYDNSLTRTSVNINVSVSDSEGREYSHSQIDELYYFDLVGTKHELKNIGVFTVTENGVYTVYARVGTLEATLEVNITNIDREAPVVIVADTININTSEVESVPYVFDPYAQVITMDNASLGERLEVMARYYYPSLADNTCKITMGNEIEHNIFDYLYGFNDVCVVYTVKDEAGNSREAISRINVTDNTRPTITRNVDEIILEIGDEQPSDEELIYRFGLVLDDNSLKYNPEREMSIEADFSNVDFTELNRYPIYISAIDISGNVSESITLTVVVTERILVIDAAPNQYIVYGEEMIDIAYTCNGNPCIGDLENSEILVEDWDKLTGELYIASGAKYSGTYTIYSSLEINSRKYIIVEGTLGVFTIKQRTFKIIAHSHEIDYKDEEPVLTWYMDTSVCNPDLSTKYTSFDEINYSCTFLEGDDFGGGAYYYGQDGDNIIYAGGIVREQGIEVKYDANRIVTYYKILKEYEDKSAGLRVDEVSNGGRDNYYIDFYGLYEGFLQPGYARFYIYPKYVEIIFSDVNKIYGESDPETIYRNNVIDEEGNVIEYYEGEKREDNKTNVQYEFTCFSYKEPIKSMNQSQCQQEIQMYVNRESGEIVGSYRIIGMWDNLNYDVRFNETVEGGVIDSAYLNILKRDITIKVDGEDGEGNYDIFYEDPLPNVTLSITSDPSISYIGLAKGSYVDINDMISIISFADITDRGEHPIKYVDSNGNVVSVVIGGYDEYVPGAGIYTITRDTFTILDKDGNDALNNYNLEFIDGTLEVHQRLIYIQVVDGLGKTYGDLDPVFTSADLEDSNQVVDGSGNFILRIINTLDNSDILDDEDYMPFDKDKLVYHLKRTKEGYGIDSSDIHYGEMVGEYLVSTDYFEEDDNYIIEMYPSVEYKFVITKRTVEIVINNATIEFNYDNIVPKFSYRFSNLAFTDALIGQPTVSGFDGEYRNNGRYQISKEGIRVLTSAIEISSSNGYWYINGENTFVSVEDIELDASIITIVDGKYEIIDVDNGENIVTDIEVSEIDITSWNYEVSANNAVLSVVARKVTIIPLDGGSKQYGDPDPVYGFATIHYGNPEREIEVIRRESDFIGALTRVEGEKPNEDPGYELLQGSLAPAQVGVTYNFEIMSFESGHYFKITKRRLVIRHAASDPETNVVEVEYGYDALNSIVSGFTTVEGTEAYNPVLCTMETIDGFETCDPIYDTITGGLTTDPLNPRDVGEYKIKGDNLRMVRVANPSVDVTDYYDLIFIEAELHILPRVLYITPSEGQSKIYGENDLADSPGSCGITYTYTPTLAYSDVEETIRSGCLQRLPNISADGRETTEEVGRYKIGMGNLSFGDNYTLVFQGDVEYLINERPITITAIVKGENVRRIENMNAYTMTYGNEFELDYEVSGMGLAVNENLGINDKIINNVMLSPSYNGVGEYRVIQGSLYIENSKNYVLTFHNATFNVNKREVIIQPKEASKNYGDPDPLPFEFDFISEVVPYSGMLTRLEGETIGRYKFSLDSLDFGGNYNVRFANEEEAFFIINPRIVYVNAIGVSMLYGTPKEEYPELKYTYTVDGDFELDIPFTGELSVTHDGEVGEYEIEIGNLGLNVNYDIRYTSAIFEIYYTDVTSISIKSLTDNKYQVQGGESTVRLYAEFNRGADPILLNDVVWSVVKNGSIQVTFDRDANNIISFTPSQSLGTYLVIASYNGISASYEVIVSTNNVSEIIISFSGTDPNLTNQKLGEERDISYYADIHLRDDFDDDLENVVIEWYAGSTKVCEHKLKANNDTCVFNPNVIDQSIRIGTHKVYARITDVVSNELDLIIRDNELPKIELEKEGEVYYIEVFQNATNNSVKYVEPGFKASDDVDGDLTNKVIVKGVDDINYYKVGTYYIVYEVSDQHGHVANNFRTVIVQDTVAPVVKLNNPDLTTIYIEYGDEYVEFGATASDAYDDYYGNELVVYIDSNLNINKVGTYEIIYFAVDSNGLRGQVSRTVIVQDTIKPIITLIGESIVYVEYRNSFKDQGAWFDDNYDGRYRIYASTIIFTPEGSEEGEEVSSVDTSQLGRYVLTYYQQDSSGNPPESSAVRTVIVRDFTPPVITLKGSNPYILRYGDEYVEPGFTVIDNYDGDITNNSDLVTVRAVIGNTLGTYYVYYNAIDTHKNTSVEVIREVIILDLISPIIYFTEACPQYITIEALVERYDEKCNLPGVGFRIFDDYTPDIDAIQTWAEVRGSVDNTTIGTYEITYDVSDRSGNKAITLTRYVNVVDTTPPTIELKPNEDGDIDFYVEVFSDYIEPGWVVHDLYDDYHDLEIIVEVVNDININLLNTYTVSYIAIDSNGNESEPVYRNITVRDTVPPVVTLIGDPVLTLERGYTRYTEYGATATDNYDDKIDEIVITGAPSGYNIGSFDVEYCATDSSGNVGCATRIVNVVDTIAPDVLGVEDGRYYRGALYIYYAPLTGTDEILTGELNGELISSPWYITREGIYHLEVRDDAGNETIIDFVIDTTAPTLYGANDKEYLNHPVTIYSDELLSAIYYRANNGGYVYTTDQSILFDREGEYTVYAVDMAGNSSQSNSITFVVDLTPPAYVLDGVLNGGITDTNVSLVTEPDVIVSVNNEYISTVYTFTENGYYKVTIRDKAGNDVFLQFVINKKDTVTINGKEVKFISQNNAIEQFIAKANSSYPKGLGFIYAKPLLDGTFEYISSTLFSDEEYTKLINGEDLIYSVPSVAFDEMVVAFIVPLDELNKFTTQTVEGDDDSVLIYALAAGGLALLVGGFFYFFIFVKRKKDEEEEVEEEIIDDDNFY